MWSTVLYLCYLFIAKVVDNALGTAKMLLVQRNRCLLAGVAMTLSTFIYFIITKDVVASADLTSMIVVSIAAGVGCCLAVMTGNRFSKERTYVNVIMSDDIEAMKALRGFLAENKITNTAYDSYTMDWESKTLTITAYAETKDQSRLIDEYLASVDTKFKRVVQGEVKRRAMRSR